MADGDDYIVNGTKIWTTHAHYANRMFCLVRTGQFERPQMGVTFLLLDMKAPGVTTQPIRFFSGDYEQSQVFFDNVRVPRTQVVGEENKGWSVTKYLLEFERGGGSAAPSLIEAIEKVRALHADDSRAAGRTSRSTSRLDALEAEVQALEMTELRCVAEMEKRGSPGAASSMLKIKGTELSQQITEVAIEAAAYYGVPYQPEAIESLGRSGFVGPEDSADRHAVLLQQPRRLDLRRLERNTTKHHRESSARSLAPAPWGKLMTLNKQIVLDRKPSGKLTIGLFPHAVESGERSGAGRSVVQNAVAVARPGEPGLDAGRNVSRRSVRRHRDAGLHARRGGCVERHQVQSRRSRRRRRRLAAVFRRAGQNRCRNACGANRCRT